MKLKRFLIASSAVLLALASCTRETVPGVQEQELTVSLSAESGQVTKTYVEYSEETGYTPCWLSTDAVKAFDGGFSSEGASLANASAKGEKAVFQGTMSLAAGEHTLYAFYPSNSHSSGTASKVTQTYKTIQTADNDNLDPDADILVSEPIHTTISQGQTALSLSDVRFARKVSFLKLVLADKTTAKAISSESVLSISVTAPGCTLSGECLYNPSDDSREWTAAADSVRMTYASDKMHFGSGYAALLCVAPGEIPAGTHATFRMITDGHEILKTVTVREDGIKLPESRFAVINLSVADENVSVRRTPMTAALLRSTSSTLDIAWSCDAANSEAIKVLVPTKSGMDYTTDLSKTYRIALYRDETCSDLEVSWNVQATMGGTDIYTVNYPPRFCFSGLEPDTDYFFTVTNTTDNRSLDFPLKVHTDAKAFAGEVVTSNPKSGDVILFENFDKLLYGGDLTAFSAGYSRTDRGSLTEIIKAAGEDPKVADENFYNVIGSTEIGLFNTLKGLVDDFGLEDWCMTTETGAAGSVCARPGYIKIGVKNSRTAIITPQLSALSVASSVKVTFKACPYGATSIVEAERAVAVRVLNGGTVASDTHILTGATESASEAFTLDGDQTTWKEYSVTLYGVNPTSRIAIDGNRGTGVSNRFMVDDIRIEYLKEDDCNYGYIYDTDGKTGVSGVFVTDGYTFTRSAADGYWEIPKRNGVEFIYYTLPETREIVVSEDGFPSFWKKYSSSVSRYDFTLGPAITKQTKWDLVVMADPQTHEGATYGKTLPWFKSQVAPDIKDYVSSYASGPDGMAYGMVLGDISWNSSLSHATSMKTAMKSSNTGVYWYTVIGNHDWYTSDSTTKDEASDANYKSLYGPTRYSFNRGDVHIIGMNNIIPIGTAGESDGGFSDDEYNWLVNDLKTVSKYKCVILCCHRSFLYNDGTASNHFGEAIDALSAFTNAFIFAGHSHYNRRVPTSSTTGTGGYVMEHIHAAAFGNLWRLKSCSDGCPAGYTIYRFNGTDFYDIIYKGVGHDADDEGRIYWGGDSGIGTNVTPYSFGGTGYEKYIYVNLFLGHSEKASKQNPGRKWTVELYQDGVKCGTMSRITTTAYKYESSYLYACHPKPTIGKTGYPINNFVVARYGETAENYIRNDLDHAYLYWALEKRADQKITDRNGGVYQGQPYSTAYCHTCYHMWCGTLNTALTTSNFKTANIEVRATNPYGRQIIIKGITPIGSNISDVNWGQ